MPTKKAEPLMAKSPTAPAKKAYLIWDEGFAPRFACGLLCLLLLGAACVCVPSVWAIVWGAYQEILVCLMEGASRMAWWSVIGLLSSSCCALQLVLNAFNVGCAGFNTVLGPVRPQLCAVTLCCQSAVWYAALSKREPIRWLYLVPSTSLAVALTLLPEMVYLRTRCLSAGPSAGRGPAAASCLVLAVEGMGCVACTSKIAEVLRTTEGVLTSQVHLEAKEASASLALGTADAERDLVPLLLERIDEAGFEATVKSLGPAPGADSAQTPATSDAAEAATGRCSAGESRHRPAARRPPAPRASSR